MRGPFLFDDSAVLGFVCLLGVSDLVLWTQDSRMSSENLCTSTEGTRWRIR